jgi:hypothetical protein
MSKLQQHRTKLETVVNEHKQLEHDVHLLQQEIGKNFVQKLTRTTESDKLTTSTCKDLVCNALEQEL